VGERKPREVTDGRWPGGFSGGGGGESGSIRGDERDCLGWSDEFDGLVGLKERGWIWLGD